MESSWETRSSSRLELARNVAFCVLVLATVTACTTTGAPSSSVSSTGAPTAAASPGSDDDMDEPLAKAPNAKFRSPFQEQQAQEAAARRAAEEANDPSRLPAQSINSPFRAFAAGSPLRVHALNV